MFADVVAAASEADVVVCYLPVASMGSAVELHEARKRNKTIVCVVSDQMASNWVVRSYSDVVVSSVDELQVNSTKILGKTTRDSVRNKRG